MGPFPFLGFIGHMENHKTMEGAVTPLLLQAVLKLAYRYGKTEAGRKDSYIYVRVNAFPSRACLSKSFEPLYVGMPIAGVLGLTESGYNSAQLVGWTPTTYMEWWHAKPRSYFDEGIQLCSGSIYNRPQLSDRNFAKLAKPVYRLCSQPDALKLVAAASFNLPPARQRRARPDDANDALLPLGFSPFPAGNASENSLFNEAIQGSYLSEELDADEANSQASPPVPVPNAAEVPAPAFPKATLPAPKATAPVYLEGISIPLI